MRYSLLAVDEFAVDPFQTRSKRRTTTTTEQQQQQKRVAQHNETRKVLGVPLIAVNKLIFRSRLEKGTYKPVELLSYGDVMKQLKCSENDRVADNDSNFITRRIRSLSMTEKVCHFMFSFL